MILSRLRGSLRWKLVLVTLLIETVTMAILFANTGRLFDSLIGQQAQQKIRDLAPMLNVALAPDLYKRDYVGMRLVLDDLLRDTKGSLVYLVVLDEDGKAVASGGEVDTVHLPAIDSAPDSGSGLFNGALPLRLNMQKVGELRYGLSLSLLFKTRAMLLQQGVWIAILGVSLSAFALALGGYWLTRHLHKLVLASREIASGRYDVRANIGANDETGQLAAGFNAMAEAVSRHLRALQRSAVRLNEAQQMAMLGSWELDLAGGDLLWSDEIYRLFELDREKFGATYEAFLLLVHPEDRQAVDGTYRLSLENRLPYEIHHRLLFADGRIKWMHEKCETEFDRDGRPLRSRGTVQDVTERYLAQQALRQMNDELEIRVARRTADLQKAKDEAEKAKDEAEKASLAKSEFLSRMSHELRTPLNGILGFAQLLQQETTHALDVEQNDFVEEIIQSGEHLLKMINELLDLHELAEGRIQPVLEPVAIAVLVCESVELMQAAAMNRNIRIRHELAGNYVVRADPVRLRQLVLNLLSNAIRFNRVGGTVVIRCSSERQDRAMIEVADSGCGISDAQFSKLFRPFERLQTAYGNPGGAGIGLVLAKRWAEAMGGVIGVRSNVGSGSTFWVEFPLLAVEPLPSAPSHDQFSVVTRPAQEILYIEDNPSSLRLVEKGVARRMGLGMLGALTAEQGIALARVRKPQVILMDINLPGMNGFEALAILRADPVTSHIPVIAISANAMERDIRKGLAAGFAEYLTKPLDSIQLVIVLGKWLDKMRQPAH